MMKTIGQTFLILALLGLTSAGFAIEDTPENRSIEADRYLKATPPEEMFSDMAEQVAKNLPAGEREAFQSLLTKHLDVDSFTKIIKAAMVKNFSAEELGALADFYGSPVGKSAMKKFGSYMADVMPGLQEEMAKATAKASEEKAELN